LELKIGVNNSVVSEVDRLEALSNSDNVCDFCGFKADKFQEVLSYDGENVTACSFCYQTANLFACADRRAGYLIYLPELTQIELNHVLRAIYVARTDINPKIADKARRAFDVFTARRKIANEILGTDDPKTLAEIIASFMSDAEKKLIPAKLSGIRVLSLDKKIELEDGMEFNEFPQMLNFWKSSVDFLNSPCSNWEKVEAIVAEEPVVEVASEEMPVAEEKVSEEIVSDDKQVPESQGANNEEVVDG
jgi:hypothetical protein